MTSIYYFFAWWLRRVFVRDWEPAIGIARTVLQFLAIVAILVVLCFMAAFSGVSEVPAELMRDLKLTLGGSVFVLIANYFYGQIAVYRKEKERTLNLLKHPHNSRKRF